MSKKKEKKGKANNKTKKADKEGKVLKKAQKTLKKEEKKLKEFNKQLEKLKEKIEKKEEKVQLEKAKLTEFEEVNSQKKAAADVKTEETKAADGSLSIGLNARLAVKMLQEKHSKSEVASYIKGEKRITVMKAAEGRMNALEEKEN